MVRIFKKIWGALKNGWRNRHRYLGQAQQVIDAAHRVQQALPEGRLRQGLQQGLQHVDQGMHHVRHGIRTAERVQEAISGSGSGH